MANERKTENIVREHFSQYSNLINIEEQKSDNPKIDKLLKTASKKGSGQGYPEFIITYKDNPDLLIVIECKANITKHESKNKDKYSEYAVDGALLYASYLAKDFDVIAIAVSGETKSKLKISHFLQLKTEKKAVEIFGNKLLSPDDYLKGYIESPQKARQDYYSLLAFTKDLNEKLHKYKILANRRSLLISAVLIALDNSSFKKTYSSYSKPNKLADFLIFTTINELENSGIEKEKLEKLKTQFSFIKTDNSLSKQEGVLINIIDEIDENINNFIKNYQYIDVLGQLYIEFLRYANSDKGLGIVLTPPHITELFAELAQVNKNSIVYDNCTGTGGFLISAMGKMIEDAKGDINKIKEIKKQQLIGVEAQDYIYALAVSNMYVHQDGKTNIYNGDCFNEEIIKKVSKQKPNVGFLNPPYKTKDNDKEELEFVYNNLQQLEKGSYCVAIVPQSCALADRGEGLVWKEKIMSEHTLDGVFSMPDELFYNSKVSVATCIMVFKAKTKHPDNYKTYFGLWKDDGFIKIKKLGRNDYFDEFKTIKENWVTNFRNRDEIVNESVKTVVRASDEWLGENYITIDFFKNIKKENFISFIRNYVGSLFLLNKIDNVVPKSVIKNNIKLHSKQYKYFKLTDIFTVKKGERLTKLDRIKGKIPLLTSTSLNNGIGEFIDYATFADIKKLHSDKITIDMLSNVFYHGYEYFSDDNIHTLIPKNEYKEDVTVFNQIFIAVVLKEISIRYGYGRQVRLKRLDREEIQLPINENNEIDWKFMDNYIKSLPYSALIEITEN
ncbi:N-6 DNA methylase [Lutibacter sp.]